MSYSVTVIERFRGAPDAKNESVNLSLSMIFDSLEEVCDYIQSDTALLYESKTILREINDIQKNRFTRTLLYERPGKHGRLLRIYTVVTNYIQKRETVDLI